MLRQIRKLVGVTMCNTWGINVARYSNDNKKKRNVVFMGCTFLLLACMGGAYITLLAHGLAMMGAADIIPSYILMLTSILILVFSILKAGSILFQMKTYDMLISMPIKPTVIVIIARVLLWYARWLLSGFYGIPGGC